MPIGVKQHSLESIILYKKLTDTNLTCLSEFFISEPFLQIVPNQSSLLLSLIKFSEKHNTTKARGAHCREGKTRHNASLGEKMDATRGPQFVST